MGVSVGSLEPGYFGAGRSGESERTSALGRQILLRVLTIVRRVNGCAQRTVKPGVYALETNIRARAASSPLFTRCASARAPGAQLENVHVHVLRVRGLGSFPIKKLSPGIEIFSFVFPFVFRSALFVTYQGFQLAVFVAFSALFISLFSL